MASVLMVESWLQSTGLRLPPLIRTLGHEYVLLTRDPSIYGSTAHTPHPVLRHADEVVVIDTNDVSAAIDTARDVARRRHIDGVLTTCDYYLDTAAHTAEALGLPGPTPAAVHLATRKHQVRRILRAARIPDARSAVAADWPAARKAASHLGYPLVAKPVDANAGTSVRLVADESALRDAFTEITGPRTNTRGQPLERVMLLEEVLDGPEVSVETVTRDGATTIVAVTGKTVLGPEILGHGGFVEAGHVVPAPLDGADLASVESLARRAIDALGIRHGLGHVEIRITPAGLRIVEVNPRQGGGYIFDLVRLTTGWDPLRLLVDLALGVESQPMPQQATSAAVAFIMSPIDGVLRGVCHGDDLATGREALRWELPSPGPVRRPTDNNARIGHVMATDANGHGARDLAEAAVAGLRLNVDGRSYRPLGSGVSS